MILSKGVNMKKHYVKLAPGSHSGKETVRVRDVGLEYPAGLLEKCVLLVKTVTWVLSLDYGTNKNVSRKYFVHIHHINIYIKFVLK